MRVDALQRGIIRESKNVRRPGQSRRILAIDALLEIFHVTEDVFFQKKGFHMEMSPILVFVNKLSKVLVFVLANFRVRRSMRYESVVPRYLVTGLKFLNEVIASILQRFVTVTRKSMVEFFLDRSCHDGPRLG